MKDRECTQTYGWYKLFQVFENRDRLYTTDVTDDDLRLVVAEENGISIFRRNSREDDFVETSPKTIGKTIQADITPTGDFLLGLPHLSSSNIIVYKEQSEDYVAISEFKNSVDNRNGGFLTDDHQWMVETQKFTNGIVVYKFNPDNEKFEFSHNVAGSFIVLDYAETSSDYQYSVVGARKKVYFLEFKENKFEVFQSEDINKSIAKPSITNDHKYVVFGDVSSTFFIQVYVFNENADNPQFNKGKMQNFAEEPIYASFSPNK